MTGITARAHGQQFVHTLKQVVHTFNIKGEIGVEFAKSVLDVALVETRIVRSRVVEGKFDVVNVLLLLDDADGNFGRFLDNLACVGPNDHWPWLCLHFAVHYHNFALVLGLDSWLLNEGWPVTFGLCLCLDVQVEVRIALPKFVLDVASVCSAVRC